MRTTLTIDTANQIIEVRNEIFTDGEITTFAEVGIQGMTDRDEIEDFFFGQEDALSIQYLIAFKNLK